MGHFGFELACGRGNRGLSTLPQAPGWGIASIIFGIASIIEWIASIIEVIASIIAWIA
ncbi:hypothetical protein [Bacillus sp. FJAT-27251]|uniref:hypothetical protein n=1 Tax=Bacillus sp. FJAT-27251 TaxID=1684142 RepID=UPI0012E10A34|nr:hypothetical protein [Bacillus sp. FJAT-27251]